MLKAVLKWVAAALAAAVGVGLTAFLKNLGVVPADVDPVVGIVILALATRLVNFLLSKLPVGTA